MPTLGCVSHADGFGHDIGLNTPGAIWVGDPSLEYWQTPDAVQASPGAPWVWSFRYDDEWAMNAYTLAVYDGASPASGHYFSEGIWVDQTQSAPPLSNAPGPDSNHAAGPDPAQQVSAGFYQMKSSAGSGNTRGTSDWIAHFSDGTTMEVSGEWNWGGGGASPSGVNSVMITFTMPAALVPAGSRPGFSAFLQDGDQCGDAVFYATQNSAAQTLIGTVNSPIGTVLTGRNGKTVYVLLDSSGNHVACTGACQQQWPPVMVPAMPQPGTGVTATLGDAGGQATANDSPLFYATGESPGQVLNQNVSAFGGTWHALQPNGQPVPVT